MNDPTDRGPTKEDLIDLAKAVREAARLEPRSAEPESSWIYLELTPALFNQLTEWRTRAARQLGRWRVTNTDALRVLVRMLMTDEDLTARVIATLRREGER